MFLIVWTVIKFGNPISLQFFSVRNAPKRNMIGVNKYGIFFWYIQTNSYLFIGEMRVFNIPKISLPEMSVHSKNEQNSSYCTYVCRMYCNIPFARNGGK